MSHRALARILLNLMLTMAWAGLAVAQPANDNFADAIVLEGASGSIQGSNVGATSEVGEPWEGNSVWYSWTAPESGGVDFSTCNGTDFDTILAVYTGEPGRDRLSGGRTADAS